MVDCRPAAAAPHEPHAAPNGTAPPPPESHHTQINQTGGGDMGSQGVTSPGARATTPAGVAQHVPYTHHYQSAMNPPMSMPVSVPYGVSPYYMVGGAGKAPAPGLVWVPPPAPHVPPPPLHVNPHVLKSVQLNGSDLPMNDIPTLRYYFNLGVECMWAAYGPPPPPRHYSPRDIAQDMQQMSLNDRGHNPDAHKHKAANNDKPPVNNGKNSQRSLLGPRFNKRGSGQDGNSNPIHNHNHSHNHSQNNGRNTNQYNGNKGPNNRSYSSRNGSPRAPGYAPAPGPAPPPEGEAPEPVLVPYVHYPPPVYPVQYYPVDPAADPAMINMMGGMSYMGYDEGVEYGQYFPPPHTAYLPPPPHLSLPPAPAPAPHHIPQHLEHK